MARYLHCEWARIPGSRKGYPGTALQADQHPFSQRAPGKICGDDERVRAGLRDFRMWAVDWHLPIFDNDGFIDVLVANNGDVLLLLHNSGGNGNQFLNFKH